MSLLSIPNMLDVAARAHPERMALEFERERWSYAELQQAAVRASEVIGSAVTPGRLGILSANRPGFVTAIHAAARLGSSVVPLNWRQMTDEIVWQAREAGVSLLVFDEPNAKTAQAVEQSLAIPVLPIAALENREPVGRVTPAPPIDLRRDAAIIYTSGTSGQPKGARITYGNLWYSAVASSLHLGHHADDVWLAVLSLYHIGGLSIVYRAAIGASGIVLHDRFDPGRVLCALDEGVTLVSLVPTMLQRLIDARASAPWPGSIRCILLGGAPAPPELIEACIARGIPACPTYGLTESTAQVATMPPGRLSLKPASSGLPLPLTRVRIVEHGEEVKPGEIGEIEFSGPSRFAGYLGEPERSSDGDWFGTGDAGYVDNEGYLYLVDRRTDLIVSGGENVYPAQIERMLLAHPAVLDAGVVGVPDRTWGARPVAFVVWDGIAADAERALRDHCRASLGGVRTPERVHVLPVLPRNAAGKLLRRSLRAAALSLNEG